MDQIAMLDATAVEASHDWIKVAPRGSVVTRDGRSYSFNPETLAARFAADGIDIPIDFDHAIAVKAKLGERADAVGWVKQLQARLDGLWARVEWLQTALSALTSRTHRFISPTFHHDVAGTATWLHSIALVAAPALSMPAIASASVPNSEAVPIDPLVLAVAAQDYVEARAALGIKVSFGDAVMRLAGGKID